MNKKILLFIFIVLPMLLGGCFTNTSDYDKETLAKAEATTDSYLNNNYNNIQSNEIEKIYSGEMGDMKKLFDSK